MNEQQIKEFVWKIASEYAQNGAGWAQEGVVLREIRDRLKQQPGQLPLKSKQMVLDAWHDLFLEKSSAADTISTIPIRRSFTFANRCRTFEGLARSFSGSNPPFRFELTAAKKIDIRI